MRTSSALGARSEGKRGAGDLGEALLQGVGRIEVGGEGKGVEAEFAFGVVEDELVDEVGAEEAAVEGGAGFDEDAEDVALGEGC